MNKIAAILWCILSLAWTTASWAQNVAVSTKVIVPSLWEILKVLITRTFYCIAYQLAILYISPNGQACR